MSEKVAVCRALAALIRQHGEPTEEEVTFVGMAALQLGLSAEENTEVQTTLKEGGDYEQLLGQISSKPMRVFFLRRMLAATLLDKEINEQEQALIERTRRALGIEAQLVAELVAWMKVAVDVEAHLLGLLSRV